MVIDIGSFCKFPVHMVTKGTSLRLVPFFHLSFRSQPQTHHCLIMGTCWASRDRTILPGFPSRLPVGSPAQVNRAANTCHCCRKVAAAQPDAHGPARRTSG